MAGKYNKRACPSYSPDGFHKKCSQCGETKPLEQFHAHGNGTKHSGCKECRKVESVLNNARASHRNLIAFPQRHPERAKPGLCRFCNSEFMPRRAGGVLQVFCSRTCKTASDNRQPRARGRMRAWFAANPTYSREHSQKRKRAVFAAYGGSRCACCGETELDFLSIDHINGGGSKHKREIGRRTLYGWLKESGFPSGFRVLCMNCNFGTRYGRACPHQRDRETVAL